MHYQAVLFDFDYTLGDAAEAIYGAFVTALTAMGYPAPDREAVRATIGMLVPEAYAQITGDTRPEGTWMALEALGAERDKALYRGDTVIDAQTAKNAGVDFCAVLNGTTPAGAFEDYPHVHIAPDLAELKSWLGV